MSHDVDQPLTLFDPVKYTPFDPALPRLKDTVDTDPICSDEVCGITDTFTRTVSGDWGTSDAGIAWVPRFNDPANSFSVNGSMATAVITDAGGNETMGFVGLSIPDYLDQVVAGTIDFKANVVSNNIFLLEFRGGDLVFQLTMHPTTGFVRVNWRGSFTDVAKTDWVASTWYRMRFLYDHANNLHALKIWPRDNTEPGSWTVSRTTSTDAWRVVTPPDAALTMTRPSGFGVTYDVDNLDITGVNRCTNFRFDNFNRTNFGG